MELHIPAALQAALYVGSGAVTLLVVAIIVLLLKVRGQIERVVRSVEQLEVEMTPLARETRAAVGDLRELTGRARERWTDVEGVIDPVNRKIHILFKGLETFLRAFSTPA